MVDNDLISRLIDDYSWLTSLTDDYSFITRMTGNDGLIKAFYV